MLKRFIALFMAVMAVAIHADYLDEGFAAPPMQARPQTWWHWIDCNISKEGIKADIDAMYEAGLGGFTILDIGQGIPDGDVKTLSPQWFEMVQYAIECAASHGMEVCLHNCPGWSSSGGPWIQKEDAMKTVTFSETYAEGGKRLEIKLPQPGTVMDFYRDIAVLAFPSVAGDGVDFRALNPKLTSTLKGEQHLDYVLNGNGRQTVRFPRHAKAGEDDSITFEFDKPFEAGTIGVELAAAYRLTARLNAYSSDDGVKFEKFIGNAPLVNSRNQLSFNTRNARFYKFEFVTISNPVMPLVQISLQPGQRIQNVQGKAYFIANSNFARGASPTPASVIAKDSVVDVSKFMSADGKLAWDAPAGKWTIVRFGYTLTGRYNHPTTKFGRGLECDKMSKKAVKAAWDGMMGIVVKNAGPLAGTALKGSLIDSYEVGVQNWTDTFRDDFRRLRGYDVLPLLPILTGRFMESADYTERFLNDYRRAVTDLFAECYADYFKQLCHEAKLDFFSEPYGGPFDQLRQGREADIPMGEFCGGPGATGTGNASLAGNLAQVYGRKYASTETFTARPENGRWQMHPAARKIQGDNAYIAGVNRFIFHSYAHQPWTVTTPGMTMGQWGFHFNRHNTLWRTFPAWLAYLARAQFMLQEGRVVSDALYVASESAPCGMDMSPALPYGYHGNCVDSDTFIKKAAVKDGRVVLPSGLSVPLLIVKHTKNASPELLAKIAELAENGASILLGDRPASPLGLTNYPAADNRQAALAQQLWGDMDGKAKTSRTIGKGRVFFGVTPEVVLKAIAVQPDFTVAASKRLDIRYLHRTDDNGNDWYFVTNARGVAADFTATFRVNSRLPELWNAETGLCETAAVYDVKDGAVNVQMHLDEGASVFVVFRKPLPARSAENAVTTATWIPANNDASLHQLVVKKASYEAIDGPGGKDVTELLQKLVSKDETLDVAVTNASLGGDPTPMRYKQLVMDYEFDGKPVHAVYPEHAEISIPATATGQPTYELHSTANGKLAMTAWVNGTLAVKTANGERKIAVENLPKPIAIDGPWNVSFPPNLGAPTSAVFPKLMSYTDSDDSGIRYFSGTSTYTKSFDLPAQNVNAPLLLDLGNVMVNARVFVNGHDCGILWKSPYRINVTGLLKEGKNDLRIEVTNRWINRLIGDEQLPPDVEWRGVALKAWPQWFKEGKPSPTGRIAFTTWHHWNKDDKLQPAGLLGPVNLYIGTQK